MRWIWILILITNAVSLIETDAYKTRKKQRRLEDVETDNLTDRLSNLVTFGIATWQLYELWLR